MGVDTHGKIKGYIKYEEIFNFNGNIKSVQYVTMEDIYEKFGSVVIITG